MAPKPKVIELACPHSPHTHLTRVHTDPPEVVFSSCEECAFKFAAAVSKLGGEIVKPKNMM